MHSSSISFHINSILEKITEDEQFIIVCEDEEIEIYETKGGR